LSGQNLILVVEDNPINQILTSSVLERDGYRVQVVGSAEDALAYLAGEAPDLILMDVQLPGQDGLSLSHALSAAAETGNIPIVALTALAMMGDKERALAAGCVGYISKPIDTRTLGAQVGRFLTRLTDEVDATRQSDRHPRAPQPKPEPLP
jgi:CheY-like chemotaxis protein